MRTAGPGRLQMGLVIAEDVAACKAERKAVPSLSHLSPRLGVGHPGWQTLVSNEPRRPF
jgi:hypothetical protein